MTNIKALELVGRYREYLKGKSVPIIKYPNDMFVSNCNEDVILSHCHSMLSGIEQLILSGDPEKRDRGLKRLGFVECCLWATGQNTVNDLKEFGLDLNGEFKNPDPLTREDLTDDWEY